jgi:hypothetical protein
MIPRLRNAALPRHAPASADAAAARSLKTGRSIKKRPLSTSRELRWRRAMPQNGAEGFFKGDYKK